MFAVAFCCDCEVVEGAAGDVGPVLGPALGSGSEPAGWPWKDDKSCCCDDDGGSPSFARRLRRIYAG